MMDAFAESHQTWDSTAVGLTELWFAKRLCVSASVPIIADLIARLRRGARVVEWA